MKTQPISAGPLLPKFEGDGVDTQLTALWDMVLAMYASEQSGGRLGSILQKLRLVKFQWSSAYFCNTGEALGHSEQQLVKSTIIKNFAKMNIFVNEVNFTSQRIFKPQYKQGFFSVGSSNLPSPEEITDKFAFVMNVKEAELLGLITPQWHHRAILSYCLVKFGYDDLDSFAAHMNYSTTDQMFTSAYEVELLRKNDRKVSKLVKTVMEELLTLFMGPFHEADESENKLEGNLKISGENIVLFPGDNITFATYR